MTHTTAAERAQATAQVNDRARAGEFSTLWEIEIAAWDARDAGNFPLAFALDNLYEEQGGHADNRVTCWTCKTWADDDHAHDQVTGELIRWSASS